MADFEFCPNSQIAETLVRETNNTVTFSGWLFAARPTSPMQRKFRLRLHGLRWYLNADGTYDTTTDPGHNAAVLEEFYATHEQWDSFTWLHPHLDEVLTVKFAGPVNVPAGMVGGDGLLEPLEVMFIEPGA